MTWKMVLKGDPLRWRRGPPFCQIRQCTRKRGLDLCSQCPDFPCPRIEALGAIYPTLIADNRIKADLDLDVALNLDGVSLRGCG